MFGFWLSLLAGSMPLAIAQSELEQNSLKIDRRYTSIKHISPIALQAMWERQPTPVLFDTREKVEYDISHLPGAIRLSPGARPKEVINKLSDVDKNREIIFYCSVGERSSRMAVKTLDVLVERGFNPPKNLRGGIFAWHGIRAPLQNVNGSTDEIHGYDSTWSRLIQRRDARIRIDN